VAFGVGLGLDLVDLIVEVEVVLWLSSAGMMSAVRHSVHSALSSTRRVIASAGAVVFLCVVVDVVDFE
jgi:hypothetical protein